MKLLFLDIGGVLNTTIRRMELMRQRKTFVSRLTAAGDLSRMCDPVAVCGLKMIIDKTGAGIVITSSLRRLGLRRVQKMWEKANLPGVVCGITPDAACQATGYEGTPYARWRGAEIGAYLHEHALGVEAYCIFDDIADMLPTQQSHFVRINPYVGISMDDVCLALRILGVSP